MTTMEEFEAETREYVMRLIDSKAEDVARRDNLDLKKPADLVTAYSTVCTDPELHNYLQPVQLKNCEIKLILVLMKSSYMSAPEH